MFVEKIISSDALEPVSPVRSIAVIEDARTALLSLISSSSFLPAIHSQFISCALVEGPSGCFLRIHPSLRYTYAAAVAALAT